MSPRLLALMPSAVALNLAMGFIVNQLYLPVYLDTTGTVLTAALAGPVAGVGVGVLSQLIRSMYEGYIWLPFALVQVVVAVVAGLAAARAGFRSAPRSVVWGLGAGAVGGSLSAVISYVIFKGVTATGVTAITTLLVGVGLSRAGAVTAASVGTDLLDKAVVFALVGLMLRALPGRVRGRFAWAARAVGR